MLLLMRRKRFCRANLQLELHRLARQRHIGFRFATSLNPVFTLPASSGRRGNVIFVLLAVDTTFLLDRNMHGREFGRSEPF